MKILVLDPPGYSGLSLAMKCQEKGHDVKLYITPSEKTENVGKGLVPVVDDWRKWILWADLTFLTENGKYLREIDRYRKDGANVLGPTEESAMWELDRKKGQDILKKAGIETIPYTIFTDYDKAIEFVKKNNKRYVSKPFGDGDDKSLSYVSKSPADMVFMLQRWKKNGKLKGNPFILQEFISGIEMAVGGWFGPHGFSYGWCENFEFKKLMNDDKGPNTGEQGTVLCYTTDSKLADELLVPITDALKKTGHTGYIDVAAIIDDNGNPWPMEFTMRPGWPLFHLQQECHDGDIASWLYDMTQGIDAQNVILDTPATCIVMSIPDYPYSKITRKDVTGIPLYGVTKGMMPHIHPCQMMATIAPHSTPDGIKDKKCLGTAGDYVLVATGSGDTVKQSAIRAYAILDKLDMPNSPMWRTDIGKRLKKQIPALQQHGYAIDLVY